MGRLALSILTLAVASAPIPASAFSVGARGTPLAYAQRGLTLRKGQLRVDAGPPDFALLDSGIRNNGRSVLAFARRDLGAADETFVGFGWGAAYGIQDDLEVGTLLIPVLLAPDVEFGDLEVYGRYRFVGGEFEVGGQAAISLPTNTLENQSNFALVFGVPMLLHMSSTARIDLGAELEIILGDADGVVNLDMPAAFQFQVNDTFFAGPKTSIFFANMEEIQLGAGAVAGISIANSRGRPVIDILGEFYWPFFLASDQEDAVNLDQFNLVLGVRVFFSTSSAERPSRSRERERSRSRSKF